MKTLGRILKISISLLSTAALIAFLGFLTVLSFPPFHWSQPASDIMSAASATNEAIDAALEKDRDMIANIRKLTNGEVACQPAARTNIDILRHCLADEVSRTERENASLDKILVSSQNKLRAAQTSLERAAAASDNRVFTFFDQFKRLLKWLGPTITVAILVVALICSAAYLKPNLFTYFNGKASFNIGGLSLNLENIEIYRQQIGTRFKNLDEEISFTYRKKLVAEDLDALFASVKRRIDQAFKEARNIDLGKTKHRATLFVPGFVGDELVQATTYFGHEFSANSGGAGRRFSVRYGIIGKSWRLQHALYNAKVTNEKRALIRLWGFTRAESENVHDGEASLVTFVIRPDIDCDPLGVIYLEGYKANAFGSPSVGESDDMGLEPGDIEMEKLWKTLAEKNDVKTLVESLRKLRNELNWDSKVAQKTGG